MKKVIILFVFAGILIGSAPLDAAVGKMRAIKCAIPRLHAKFNCNAEEKAVGKKWLIGASVAAALAALAALVVGGVKLADVQAEKKRLAEEEKRIRERQEKEGAEGKKRDQEAKEDRVAREEGKRAAHEERKSKLIKLALEDLDSFKKELSNEDLEDWEFSSFLLGKVPRVAQALLDKAKESQLHYLLSDKLAKAILSNKDQPEPELVYMSAIDLIKSPEDWIGERLRKPMWYSLEDSIFNFMKQNHTRMNFTRFQVPDDPHMIRRLIILNNPKLGEKILSNLKDRLIHDPLYGDELRAVASGLIKQNPTFKSKISDYLAEKRRSLDERHFPQDQYLGILKALGLSVPSDTIENARMLISKGRGGDVPPEDFAKLLVEVNRKEIKTKEDEKVIEEVRKRTDIDVILALIKGLVVILEYQKIENEIKEKARERAVERQRLPAYA